MDELNSAQTAIPDQGLQTPPQNKSFFKSRKQMYLITGSSILVFVLMAAALAFVFTNQNSQDNSTKTAKDYVLNSQFDFNSCLRDQENRDKNGKTANDICVNFQEEYRLTQTNLSPSTSGTVASSATPIPTQSGCSPEAAIPDARGQFKQYPFDIDNIQLISLGKDTNDPRFVYPWIKSGSVKIYAPADGILFRIRHKVFEIDGLKGNDFDIFFQVDCGTVFRFNHITDPRADIKAAYPAGDLPSGDYANAGLDIPERIKPLVNIKVKAGESLGSTSGTPTAHNFDFAVGVAKEAPKAGDPYSVCPFSVFNEPMKTQLLNLLGPKNGSPTPGFVCDVPSQKF